MTTQSMFGRAKYGYNMKKKISNDIMVWLFQIISKDIK